MVLYAILKLGRVFIDRTKPQVYYASGQQRVMKRTFMPGSDSPGGPSRMRCSTRTLRAVSAGGPNFLMVIVAVLLIAASSSGFALLPSRDTTSIEASTSGRFSSNPSSASHGQSDLTSPATTTAADTCTYPGQSMGFYLRVLHDSNSTPVVGASVTGAYRFPYTCTPDSTEQLSTSRPILGFATNETEWHPLYGINDGTYALTVVYSDREYNLTA